MSAAGGLETARLLLASNKDRPCGLGNEADLVGRFYMTRFVGALGGIALSEGTNRGALCFQKARDGVYARRYLEASGAARQREGLGGRLSHRHGALMGLAGRRGRRPRHAGLVGACPPDRPRLAPAEHVGDRGQHDNPHNRPREAAHPPTISMASVKNVKLR